MNHEKGVSEIIGAVLLVGLVMAGMGLIGIMLITIPPPNSLVKVSLSASCCQCSNGNYTILIYHDSGDPLKAKDLKFNETLSTGEVIESKPVRIYDDEIETCSFDYDTVGHPYDNSSSEIFAGQYIRIRLKNVEPSAIQIKDSSTLNRILLDTSFSCDDKCRL